MYVIATPLDAVCTLFIIIIIVTIHTGYKEQMNCIARV